MVHRKCMYSEEADLAAYVEGHQLASQQDFSHRFRYLLRYECATRTSRNPNHLKAFFPDLLLGVTYRVRDFQPDLTLPFEIILSRSAATRCELPSQYENEFVRFLDFLKWESILRL